MKKFVLTIQTADKITRQTYFKAKLKAFLEELGLCNTNTIDIRYHDFQNGYISIKIYGGPIMVWYVSNATKLFNKLANNVIV